jgi:hypothetical protein
MIHTIYLDLDDVLNTCTPYLLQQVGCPVQATDYSKCSRAYNIVGTANRLLGFKRSRDRFTRQTFWQSISRRAWAEIPCSLESAWLLRACKRIVGRREVYIATCPIEDPECMAGKLEWIHRNLPTWMHRQFFVTPRKWKLSQPGTLLIDDNEANCRKFEAAGGVALRFPRPWNTARGWAPRTYLAAGLSRLAGFEIR